MQGNKYVGIERIADVTGEPGESIRDERLVHNVITAIDYSTWMLANQASTAAEKAVALCWVLHLMGDIHQPLHTGRWLANVAWDNPAASHAATIVAPIVPFNRLIRHSDLTIIAHPPAAGLVPAGLHH